MSRRTKRNALLGVAVAVIAAGAIVAVATSSGGSGSSPASHAERASARRRTGSLAVAAAYLGLTRAQLREDEQSGKTLAQIANSTPGKSETGLIAALLSAQTARLNAAVSTHQETPAQQQARLAKLHRRLSALVNRVRAARVAGVLSAGVSLRAASSYLGVSAVQLREELRSGRSLAQVADATSGKSAAGLTEALVSTRKAKLEAAAAAGTITKSRESALISSLPHRVAAAVNRTPKPAGHSESRSHSATAKAEREPAEGEASESP